MLSPKIECPKRAWKGSVGRSHPSSLHKALELTSSGTRVPWAIAIAVGTALALPRRKKDVPAHSSWTQPLSAPPAILPSVLTVYKETKVNSAAIPDPTLLQTEGEMQGCGILRINCN